MKPRVTAENLIRRLAGEGDGRFFLDLATK
jgi:hypothetical protein